VSAWSLKRDERGYVTCVTVEVGYWIRQQTDGSWYRLRHFP
jgi:hypothetical protein